MRVLGFDFGTKRIGVAVGNTITQSANAVTVIQAKQGKPNWDEVRALVKEWQPEKLIVGLPTQFDGSDITVTQQAAKFARRLAEQCQLPVEQFDERLTSHEARSINKTMNQSSNKDRVDDLAAQIIVQSWLNALNNGN